MMRLLTTYRWEVWLLLGVPVFSFVVQYAASSLWIRLDFNWDWLLLVGALLTAVLQGVSYPRVKRLGRDFFTLVWGYALAAAVIAAVFQVVRAYSPIDWGAPLTDILRNEGLYFDTPSILRWLLKWAGLREIAMLLALIVFARRASRFSLAHAYFLFLITQHYFYLSSPGGSAPLLVWSVSHSFYFAMTLVFVWLLGNFESRGPRFHRRATAALAAAWMLLPIAASVAAMPALADQLLSPILKLRFLLFKSLLLAVIYLVRERDPKGATPPAPAEA